MRCNQIHGIHNKQIKERKNSPVPVDKETNSSQLLYHVQQTKPGLSKFAAHQQALQ
jgi:hypothetical protein